MITPSKRKKQSRLFSFFSNGNVTASPHTSFKKETVIKAEVDEEFETFQPKTVPSQQQVRHGTKTEELLSSLSTTDIGSTTSSKISSLASTIKSSLTALTPNVCSKLVYDSEDEAEYQVSKKRKYSDEATSSIMKARKETSASDKQKRKTSEPNLPSVISTVEPKLGERFRVKFKVSYHCTDSFHTWYFGTAIRIGMSKAAPYQITLKYDDGTIEEETYPSKTVQKIITAENNNDIESQQSDECLVYTIGDGKRKRVVAYDPNPSKLFVGDLVQCHYQNGTFNNAWYQGRVAVVHEGGKSFDVCYFDGDYECNIPLSKGNVHLIQRGSSPTGCSWLLGAQIEERAVIGSNRRKKQRVCNGEIINLISSFDHDQNNQSAAITCVVKFSRRQEEMPYLEVVTRLFSSLKSLAVTKGSIKKWPGNKVMEATKLTEPNVRIYEPIPRVFTQINDDQLEDTTLQDSIDSLQSLGETRNKKRAKEMYAPLANSMWRALNSAEPHIGFGMLLQMTAVLNIVPNSQLTRNLFDFVVLGPKSEGTHFREANRTELVSSYLNTMLDKLYQPDCALAPKIAPMKWNEVEQIISLPISQTEDNPCSSQLRLALQMSSSSLSFLSKLFYKELQYNNMESNVVVSRRYVSQPLCSTVLDNKVRDSLKIAVRLASQSWIRHGHWLYGYINEDRRACKSSDEQQCTAEVKRCFNSLGEIVCFLSWLYCVEENIPFGDNDCCFVIVDAMSSELEKAYYNNQGKQSARKTSKAKIEKYVRRIKLRFVLSLDTKFSRPLQLQLGNMMKLSSDLSIVIGS